MKQNIDDNNLILIFKNHKKEILDEGFSEKVFQKLPSGNNFYVTTYVIWTITFIILITILLKTFNFTENLPLFLSHISEKLTADLTLFFKSPKIYITTFVVFLIAGGFAMKKKMLI